MRKADEIDDPSWEDIHARDNEIQRLQEQIRSLQDGHQKELANIHYTADEFIGIDGYGPFSLRKLCKDRWEIKMLREKVILYNRKGHRVRGEIDCSNQSYDGEW